MSCGQINTSTLQRGSTLICVVYYSVLFHPGPSESCRVWYFEPDA